MPVQALRTETGRNPRAVEEAQAFVAQVEKLFMPWNIDALVEGFTDDCEVRFGNVQLRARRRCARSLRPAAPGRRSIACASGCGRLRATC